MAKDVKDEKKLNDEQLDQVSGGTGTPTDIHFEDTKTSDIHFEDIHVESLKGDDRLF